MIAANSYSASLTREQFLFKETRIVAQLMDSGLDEASIYEKIKKENLCPQAERYRRQTSNTYHCYSNGTDGSTALPLCHDERQPLSG